MPVKCKHGGRNAPSDHTVFHCFRQFQRNKFSVQDVPRSGCGCPSTSLTEQTIDAVRKIIEDDPHSTYKQIEAILGINSKAINSMIHDYLNLRKVCTRWVPYTLTDDQKQLPPQFCHHSLKGFEEGRSRRVFDIITGDESCFHHCDLELKEQRKVCLSTTDQRPIQVHQNKSARKRIVAVFFVKSGLIKPVPLERGERMDVS